MLIGTSFVVPVCSSVKERCLLNRSNMVRILAIYKQLTLKKGCPLLQGFDCNFFLLLKRLKANPLTR